MTCIGMHQGGVRHCGGKKREGWPTQFLILCAYGWVTGPKMKDHKYWTSRLFQSIWGMPWHINYNCL